jgi:hypothetical protein
MGAASLWRSFGDDSLALSGRPADSSNISGARPPQHGPGWRIAPRGHVDHQTQAESMHRRQLVTESAICAALAKTRHTSTICLPAAG